MRGWTRRWIMRPEGTGQASPVSGGDGGVAVAQRTDLVKHLLMQRGMLDEPAQAAFTNPRLGDLHLPETLPGAEEAAIRLVEAVRAGRCIGIYGDYDVDGVMSTSILHQILTLVDPEQRPVWYVPHRIEEGYGLHVSAIDELAERGVEVWAVDAGKFPSPPPAPL